MHSLSRVLAPDDDDDWQRLLASAQPRGVTVRGLGRSYADAALNSGGTVALTAAGHAVRTAGLASGLVDVDAGASIGEVLEHCLPRGWMVPVLPGSRNITVGGALAADAHGKNHPSRGSFSAHVLDVDLLTPAQGLVRVGPERDPEVFWATAGGLGLTGVIRRLRLRLVPVTSGWLVCRDRAAENLDAVLAAMSAAGAEGEHAVAWVDGHAAGRALGRGVVSAARHLSFPDLPAWARRDPLRYRPARSVPAPRAGGHNLVSTWNVRAANAARFGLARRRGRASVRDVSQVLHPLDAVPGWPASYGSAGMLQYQYAVPVGAEQVLAESLHVLHGAGCPPSLAVLKRLGEASGALLGFCLPGWTLALDFPVRHRGSLAAALDTLDDLVLAAGGRVYLVKDARLPAHRLPRMYPQLGRWRAVRARLDPDGVLTSDLARRLRLSQIDGGPT